MGVLTCLPVFTLMQPSNLAQPSDLRSGDYPVKASSFGFENVAVNYDRLTTQLGEAIMAIKTKRELINTGDWLKLKTTAGRQEMIRRSDAWHI